MNTDVPSRQLEDTELSQKKLHLYRWPFENDIDNTLGATSLDEDEEMIPCV